MLFRWLTPAAFVGASIYVRYYNHGHADRKLVFPGVDMLAGPSPEAQGEMTWKLFAGFAVALAVWALWETLRDWMRRRKGEQPEE